MTRAWQAPTALDAYGIAWQPLREYFVLVPAAGVLLFGIGVISAGNWIHLAFATLLALVTAAERGDVAPAVCRTSLADSRRCEDPARFSGSEPGTRLASLDPWRCPMTTDQGTLLLLGVVGLVMFATLLAFSYWLEAYRVVRRRLICPVHGRYTTVDFLVDARRPTVYEDVVDCPLAPPGKAIACGKVCRSIAVTAFSQAA